MFAPVQKPNGHLGGKRVKDGHRLLDQSFNPVTLSRRQTVCYRSFHYVSQLQIALKVRRTRPIRRGKNPPVSGDATSSLYSHQTLSDLQDQRGQLEAGAGCRNSATDPQKRRASLLAQSCKCDGCPARLQAGLEL